FRQSLQLADEFPNPRANLAFAVPKNVIEPKNVALEEQREVVHCGRNSMIAEEFTDQAGVGASGEFQFFEAIHRLELVGEDLGKSFHPRASGVDQRAVNIE